MFTGIIETIGTVVALEPVGGTTRFDVEAPEIAAEVRIGDSIAVNGACLTVTAAAGGVVSFQVVAETLDRSSLGGLRVGCRVNLERALRADGRLDGHLVQGHIDGTGKVGELRQHGDDVRLFVECDPEIASQLVEKGSIALDGVSLTVVGVAEAGFDVALIPHTLKATTLGDRKPSDRVNLEVDVLGKYVKRYLERMERGGSESGRS